MQIIHKLLRQAFVNKFSDDLQTEYKEHGILIQSVQPGFVATNMSKIRKASVFAPSPETYVRSALSTWALPPRRQDTCPTPCSS